MSTIMTAQDVEITAMASIWGALQTLPDDEARMRCIRWAIGRSGLNIGTTAGSLHGVKSSGTQVQSVPILKTEGDPLEDIVERTDDDRFRVVARDLKAKSKNEAAVRLVYLVLYANEVLNGHQKTSSRKMVVPVLNEWRAYDGNTRWTLAKDQGIKRDGDLLSLDIHSRREAEKFIAEIRDEAVKGSWTPSGVRTRKAGKKTSSKTTKISG